ncbi:hypothetical protein Tco_1571339 [Tanacetum coccineum]
MNRKITSGACQLLGGKLVCWSAKKQQSVAMSFAKAEYVATARCCANVLWMKNQLSDYDIQYKMVPIFCAISNNLVLHSRTKHIDIRYHFIRDHILKGDIELHFIPTEYQLADIFIKPLDELTFTRLKAELGMLNINMENEAVKAELLKLGLHNDKNEDPKSLVNMTPMLKTWFPTVWRLLTMVFNLLTRTKIDIGDIIYTELVTRLLETPWIKYVAYPRWKLRINPNFLPEGKTTDPKDSEGNIQLADMGLLSTSDKGIHSLKPLPEDKPADAKYP